jgi:signal transduction histidine kinase
MELLVSSGPPAVQQRSKARVAVLLASAIAAYIVAGRIGLHLALVNPSATAVWPPTGIALATLLFLGPRVWWAIWIAAFVVNVTTSGSIGLSAAIACGNTLEALLGAFLVNRYACGLNVFDTARGVFQFALSASASSCISSAIGLAALLVANRAPAADVPLIAATWWLGDTMGALVVTPPLILWSRRSYPRRDARLRRDVITVTAFAVLAIVFFSGVVPFVGNRPLTFLCAPPLVWAAFRFGPRGASTATCLLAALAVASTVRGFGPFVHEGAAESLLLVQTFMGVMGVMALALAAAVQEHASAEKELKDAHRELELRVESRTADLAHAVRSLRSEIGERQAAESRLLEVTEREQQRLGQDLHDGLGQHLTGIAFMSKSLEQKLRARSLSIEAHEMETIRRLVSDAISKTRSLARGLSPVTLQTDGLAAALQDLALSAETLFNVSCKVECFEVTPSCGMLADSHLYHIAQEAITNAMKHGRARSIRVRLAEEGDQLVLTILDDGAGYEPKENPTGMGLRIMRHRAQVIGAAFDIRAEPTGGTRVTCRVRRPAVA